MARRRFGSLLLAVVSLLLPAHASAQRVVNQPTQIVSVAKGASALIVNPVQIQRYSIGDPNVAEPVVISPSEMLLNGKTLGTTSLLLWDVGGGVKLYTVEVTADAPGLERYLRTVLGADNVSVSASGNVIALSGQVPDAGVEARAVEIARGAGAAAVVNNLTTPAATQILLNVRFAEINRSAFKRFNVQVAAINPHKLDDNGDWFGSSNTNPRDGTFFEGLFDLGLFNVNAQVEALFNALKGKGDFRNLAEPTLVALPGKEATFLAGGEFPYPTIGGQAGNQVTIVFKEFGIRLRFTPTLTRSGSIRLKVAPEVSSLDFANALTISGFTIPSLLTRRAETEVEMREGQSLSIAGLLDNSLIDNWNKIPVLGDLPILGQFFRSRDGRQRRTELLVLVTPRLIRPGEVPDPLPTGEPSQWKWDGFLKTQRPPEVVKEQGGGTR